MRVRGTWIAGVAAGAVIVKLWLLTATACVLVWPCQVPVMVSVPLFTAVSVNDAVPVVPVVTVAGVRVLLAADVNVTCWPGMALPPESVSDTL